LEYGYKPTTNGRNLIAKCWAMEKPLVITRVAFGDGLVAEGTNLADVHELVSYVVDGTIGDRIHENDRLYMTVQYDNRSHPDVKTFYLNEFIIYAQDPESGGEVDLIYATLGDYKQAVPTYNAELPPSVWKFPIVIIVSDEVKVVVDTVAGLVTYDELNAAVNNAYKTFVETVPTGGIKKTIELTITPDDWNEDAASKGYPFVYDIVDAEISADAVPMVTVDEDSELTAAFAGMASSATSYDGYVRLKCAELPDDDITLSCTIMAKATVGTLPNGVSTTLKPATSTDLGGVIVGDGLNIDEDGRLSVNKATDKEVDDKIDDIFNPDSGGGDEDDEPGALPDGYTIATDEEVAAKTNSIFGF